MKGAKVDCLVDKHGNLILPRTITEAIADKDSGENLNQMLDGIVRCAGDEREYIEDLEEHTGEVLTRHNKKIKNLEGEKNELRQEVDEHKIESVHQSEGVHGLEVEEGTWSPRIFADEVAGNVIYNDSFGSYHRIGNLVTVNFKIAITNLGGMKGRVYVDGLPFKVHTFNAIDYEVPLSYRNIIKNEIISIVFARLYKVRTDVALGIIARSPTTNNMNAYIVSSSDITDSTEIKGTLTYITDII